MPGTQERQYAQEDALYSIILAATQAGGVLAVQPNQDGSTGIQLVEKVAPPEQQVFPRIGLAFSDYDDQNPPVGARTRELIARFDICIVVRRDYDHAVADTAAQARVDLRNYVNDGNGNGLSALLRGNPTLSYNGSANCIVSRIKHFEESVLRAEGDSAGVIALAIYQFETMDHVRF